MDGNLKDLFISNIDFQAMWLVSRAHAVVLSTSPTPSRDSPSWHLEEESLQGFSSSGPSSPTRMTRPPFPSSTTPILMTKFSTGRNWRNTPVSNCREARCGLRTTLVNRNNIVSYHGKFCIAAPNVMLSKLFQSMLFKVRLQEHFKLIKG